MQPKPDPPPWGRLWSVLPRSFSLEKCRALSSPCYLACPEPFGQDASRAKALGWLNEPGSLAALLLTLATGNRNGPCRSCSFRANRVGSALALPVAATPEGRLVRWRAWPWRVKLRSYNLGGREPKWSLALLQPPCQGDSVSPWL